MRFCAGLALLLLGLLGLVLPNLGAAPLERAEIYFLDVARTMVESGDWLVPRYQGEPFFDKPPLAYWLMAAAFAGLGPEAGAARLVPALAALGAVLATVWLGTLVFDRRTALAAGVVLSTTLAFLSFARVAMSDMPLTLLTTLAVCLGVRAYAPSPPRWAVPALGVVLGLGLAVKGPIAVLVPGVALALVAFRERGRPLPFTRRAAFLGILAFFVLGLGWYVLVYARLGAAPIAYFFLRENLERFVGEAYDVGRPAWFYLPAYAAEGLPWSPLLPIALWRLLPRGDGDEPARRSARLLAGWVALVLVLLSLSRGKIDYYLLPLYPPLSLLVARFVVGVPWKRLDRVWIRAWLVILALGLAAAALRPPSVPGGWLPGTAARAALGAVVAVTALLAVAVSVRPRPAGVMAVLGGGMAAAWLVVAALFLPAFVAAQPNRAIVADVTRERRYRPDLRLVACEDPPRARRDVLFHARLPTEERCDLWGLAASRVPYLLLIGTDEDRSFQAIPDYRRVAAYPYLPAGVLTLDGLLHLGEPRTIVLGANFSTTDPVAVKKKKRAYRKAIQNARRESRQATRRRKATQENGPD